MRRIFSTVLLFPCLADPVWASEPPPSPAPTLVSPQATDRVSWEGWGLDVATTALASTALWAGYSLMGGRLQAESPQAGALVTSVTMAAAVVTPAALLVNRREPRFALDNFIASAAGGVLGLGAAFGLSRGFTAGQPLEPLWFALALGAGQGLGTVWAYHAYQDNKPQLRDLNQLPLQRTDDPIEDWRFWQERRTP